MELFWTHWLLKAALGAQCHYFYVPEVGVAEKHPTPSSSYSGLYFRTGVPKKRTMTLESLGPLRDLLKGPVLCFWREAADAEGWVPALAGLLSSCLSFDKSINFSKLGVENGNLSFFYRKKKL